MLRRKKTPQRYDVRASGARAASFKQDNVHKNTIKAVEKSILCFKPVIF